MVQVYFVGQERDVLFIAMELVDGGSLADALEAGKRLSWQDAVRHMRGLAEGLREAARLNIIHRNIKPANILLDRFGLAHLADFGLAAPVNSREKPVEPGTPQPGGNLPKLTQVGAVMGSPPYMSPEQPRGQELDVRSDIYGLGATFYELLGGSAANTAPSYPELMAFVAGPPPPRLSLRAPQVPPKVAQLIDRCMSRDLRARFENYDQLIKAFDDAAPRPEVPASVVMRVLAWTLDVAVFAAGAGLGFVVGVLGSVAALFTSGRRSLVDILTGTQVLVDVRQLKREDRSVVRGASAGVQRRARRGLHRRPPPPRKREVQGRRAARRRARRNPAGHRESRI